MRSFHYPTGPFITLVFLLFSRVRNNRNRLIQLFKKPLRFFEIIVPFLGADIWQISIDIVRLRRCIFINTAHFTLINRYADNIAYFQPARADNITRYGEAVIFPQQVVSVTNTAGTVYFAGFHTFPTGFATVIRIGIGCMIACITVGGYFNAWFPACSPGTTA